MKAASHTSPLRTVGSSVLWPALLVGILSSACGGAVTEELEGLQTYPNPFGPSEPQWHPVPMRGKPLEVVVGPGGDLAYVSLQGTADQPSREVAVVDLKALRLRSRIRVGHGPTGLALHPSGRWLVVFNRFSPFASVIDTQTNRVAHTLEVDIYATEGVFLPSGDKLYITNRWRDAVAILTVVSTDAGLQVTNRVEPGIPVTTNPRDIAVSADGRTVAVGGVTGLDLSIIDTANGERIHHIDVGAPVSGLAFAGDFIVAATMSASTHHLPFAGPDTNHDGLPGDGTPNVNFQDLQNEIAIYHRHTGTQVHRYTSDSICCKDYRDVDPRDLSRHGDLLPPSHTWIVEGALPEQVAVSVENGQYIVFVSYSASNEVQRFSLDPQTGALIPLGTWPTEGHSPHGIAVAGDHVLVAHRLSETLGVYQAQTGKHVQNIDVGYLAEGPFPATDTELGELFNFVTAPFSVDGDQSCSHCHRENGNIDKAFSMPLSLYPGVASRMVMAYRGAADSRPWFFEAAMDETNFRPVINEFARIENFCCSDYTLWPSGAPVDCTSNPPAECGTNPNPSSENGFDPSRAPFQMLFAHPRPTPAASRDAYFADVSKRLTGRTHSFGDGLFFEDPISGGRQAIPLNFEGVTRALGMFLLAEPRLLPNPNRADSAGARRGRAIFESLQTGCATCHPAPVFAASTSVNPLNIPLVMGPVVSPMRNAQGINIDLFSGGFMQTFPSVEMETCEEVCGAQACGEDPAVCDKIRNVRFGITKLRGLWDRAPSMLHDGRARGLREVLCTPGHPALRTGERGFNERDGIPDTHGGTSHLTSEQIEDLMDYILAL